MRRIAVFLLAASFAGPASAQITRVQTPRTDVNNNSASAAISGRTRTAANPYCATSLLVNDTLPASLAIAQGLSSGVSSNLAGVGLLHVAGSVSNGHASAGNHTYSVDPTLPSAWSLVGTVTFGVANFLIPPGQPNGNGIVFSAAPVVRYVGPDASLTGTLTRTVSDSRPAVLRIVGVIRTGGGVTPINQLTAGQVVFNTRVSPLPKPTVTVTTCSADVNSAVSRFVAGAQGWFTFGVKNHFEAQQ